MLKTNCKLTLSLSDCVREFFFHKKSTANRMLLNEPSKKKAEKYETKKHKCHYLWSWIAYNICAFWAFDVQSHSHSIIAKMNEQQQQKMKQTNKKIHSILCTVASVHAKVITIQRKKILDVQCAQNNVRKKQMKLNKSTLRCIWINFIFEKIKSSKHVSVCALAHYVTSWIA